jgi:hypothetical protein
MFIVAAETCLPCHYKQWPPLLVKLFQLSAFMSQYLTGIKSHKLLLTSQYHSHTLKLSKEITTVCEISGSHSKEYEITTVRPQRH